MIKFVKGLFTVFKTLCQTLKLILWSNLTCCIHLHDTGLQSICYLRRGEQCTVHYSVQCTVCRVPVYPAEDAWVGWVSGAVGDPVGPVLGEPVLLGDGPQPAPHHRHL